MVKGILIITAAVLLVYTSVHAQVVTPSLDPMIATKAPSATAWRYASVAGIQAAGEIKGDFDSNVIYPTSTTDGVDGEIDVAADSPPILAAFKGESFAAELYSVREKTQTVESSGYFNPYNTLTTYTGTSTVAGESKIDELTLQTSYMIGDSISLGLGYRQDSEEYVSSIKNDSDTPLGTLAGTILTGDEYTLSETGTSLTAAYRSGVFFVTLGAESVSQTVSDYTRTNSGTATATDVGDNSWMNTIFGVGMLTGKPGETQFRLEYSNVSSPESVTDADGADFGNYHGNTVVSSTALEAVFGGFFVALRSEATTIDTPSAATDIFKNEGIEQTITSTGIGWVPTDGLTVSLYSVKIDKTKSEEDSILGDITRKYSPEGTKLSLGWIF